MNNSKFLKALSLQSNSTPPVWFMRQAGRYLPEYQEIRKHYSNFLDMCKQPKTCAELALQPIDRFNLDASILFSDILTIPDALNLGLAFHEGEGPKFSNPISSPQDIKKLKQTLSILKNTKVESIWLKELNELKKVYLKWIKDMEKRIPKKNKTKRKK